MSSLLSRKKQEIREKMRAVRQGQKPRDVEASSLAVARILLGYEEVTGAGTICTYIGIDKELKTDLLVHSFLESGNRVLVPDWEGWKRGSGIRLLRIFGPDDLLVDGRVVPQPKVLSGRVVPIEEVELFLVPGLAFDKSGNRLGMGGGFYDRLLNLSSPDATIIGLAYAFQILDQLPVQHYDVPVHRIVFPGMDDCHRIENNRRKSVDSVK